MTENFIQANQRTNNDIATYLKLLDSKWAKKTAGNPPNAGLVALKGEIKTVKAACVREKIDS
jgi:hypothetical protein